MSLKLVDTNWSLRSVIACCAYMSSILQLNSYSVELILSVILLVIFNYYLVYFAVLVAVNTATVLPYYYLSFVDYNQFSLLICICDDTFFKSYVVMYFIFVIIDYYGCAAV